MESSDHENEQSEHHANRWTETKHEERPANAAPEGHIDQPGTMVRESGHGGVMAETPGEEGQLHLRGAKDKAAGLPGVLRALQYVYMRTGPVQATRALMVLNQKGGIDCMSCAWPEPDGERATAEFCENGAKAIGHEMDSKKCGPEFFAKHTVAELSEKSDYWLEQQGRLTHPMVLKEGATHYVPISWDEAFEMMGGELNKLSSPDEAAFYTSGRASNEAAFVYQLFVRQFGTNNLPDCSNMCHESSGSALTATVGIGKGTVTLDDFEKTELIIILGQNPGTNHPRMLTTLQKAKHLGTKIIAMNPLKEAGLLGFMNPQQVSGMVGKSTPLADLFLQVKINGDLAVLKGMMKELLGWEDEHPGTVLDWAFIRKHTHGAEALLDHVRAANWEEIVRDSGISREQIRQAAEMVRGTDRIIACWAMGLTQQNNAVQTIQEVVNLLLMRGAMGKPGAGACPVRGHSNVQGDRTMGVWDRPTDHLLDSLKRNFNFEPPRKHGLDAVESIKAMHAGNVKVFVSLGGNFLSATPDTLYVQEALSRLDLSVRIATKLNRFDLVTGKRALILPCLGRTEIDRRNGGEQFITTENSMGVVEMSRGRFEPASKDLLSETAIICRLAEATLGRKATVPFREWGENYDLVRDAIAHAIDGCENYNQRVRHPGGFYLPNAARGGEYKTATGKANFTVNPIPPRELAPGQLVLMTLRSHDQFNTTIYGLHDRYRGVHNHRRVIFLNEQDMAERGIKPQGLVDITSHHNGQTRKLAGFTAIPYDIPRGCCGAYFPEANPLVPISSVAGKSNQPASKYVVVTVERTLS